mmetsp:Transcript_15314/g.50290  ORF Transcript_15314/g.50290 Transcript_15314/m.50290 type:complete len:325 (+) Transcript_15314:30-1004(+)
MKNTSRIPSTRTRLKCHPAPDSGQSRSPRTAPPPTRCQLRRLRIRRTVCLSRKRRWRRRRRPIPEALGRLRFGWPRKLPMPRPRTAGRLIPPPSQNRWTQYSTRHDRNGQNPVGRRRLPTKPPHPQATRRPRCYQGLNLLSARPRPRRLETIQPRFSADCLLVRNPQPTNRSRPRRLSCHLPSFDQAGPPRRHPSSPRRPFLRTTPRTGYIGRAKNQPPTLNRNRKRRRRRLTPPRPCRPSQAGARIARIGRSLGCCVSRARRPRARAIANRVRAFRKQTPPRSATGSRLALCARRRRRRPPRSVQTLLPAPPPRSRESRSISA